MVAQGGDKYGIASWFRLEAVLHPLALDYVLPEQLTNEQQTVFGRQFEHAVRLGNPLVMRRKTIRSGLRGEEMPKESKG